MTILLAQQSPPQGLERLDYAVILTYLTGVLVVGWYFSREQEEQEDYFVGGRQLPWLAVGLSIVATMLSTVTYLASPGEVIQHGLALAIGWLALPLAFMVVNFVWVPFFMRLGVTSIYEYLEDRFGLAARMTAVTLFVLILRLLWMATIVLTGSKAIALITHESMVRIFGLQWTFDKWLLAVLFGVGLVATLYTMLGGIKAVVWTDVAQFVGLVLGVLLTLLFIASRTGTTPVDWWHTTTSNAAAGHELPPFVSWDITTRNTILFTILSVTFWYACTFIGDQVAVQRYLSTPSVSAARKGNVVNFAADFLVMLLLAMCGMALLTYYLSPKFLADFGGGVTDPRDPRAADQVFPHFIVYGLPVGVSGLVVAALFAVAMSSLDSGINSVAAVLTIDVFERFGSNKRSEKGLRLPRIITLVVGIVCTLVAWVMLNIPEHYNIIGITARTFNCALGPLAAMFVVGMFVRRAGQISVVIATWFGLGVAISLAWWVELNWAIGLTDHATLQKAMENLTGPSPFLIIPLSCTATFAAASLLCVFLPNSRPKESEALLWKSVVARTD